MNIEKLANIIPNDMLQKYNTCLALEFNHPEYFQVHHLLVLSFMLRIDAYSDSYRGTALSLLKESIDRPINIDSVKKLLNKGNEQPILDTTKVNTNMKLPFDIIDVRIDSAEHYCEDIRYWAQHIVRTISSNSNKDRK